MAGKLKMTYPPSLVDAAIKLHIEQTLGLKGEMDIDYTHRRKTRRVSAEIEITIQAKLTENQINYRDFTEGLNPIPCTDPKDFTGKTEIPVDLPVSEISFDDLPEHEQQEALGEVDDENDMEPEQENEPEEEPTSMFGTEDDPVSEDMPNDNLSSEDVEDLFG